MNNEELLHDIRALPELFSAVSSFALVARRASFTLAAAELGVSPSALSQTLRMLEKKLGVRLLHRSTRRVSVTEIGQQLLDAALPGLSALEAALQSVSDMREQPSGLLRLNVSRTAADILVMPHLAAFLDQYPDIAVELHCDNALLDLVRGRFDAGIRLGENLANDVVAVPLGGSQRIAVVASPAYFAHYPEPAAPSDLRQHRCVNARLGERLYRWEFIQNQSGTPLETGAEFSMDVDGPLISNDGEILLQAVRCGIGIACVFEARIQDDLATGKLIPVLQRWWPVFPGFYIYYSSRMHMTRKLRVFIDFMQAQHNTATTAALNKNNT